MAESADIEQIVPDRQVQGTKYYGGPDYGWMVTEGFTRNGSKLPNDGTESVSL